MKRLIIDLIVANPFKPQLNATLRFLVDIGSPCEILITIEGETFTTPCVLGDEGDLLLLGAVILEQFGLGVDPVRKVLVPVAGFRA